MLKIRRKLNIKCTFQLHPRCIEMSSDNTISPAPVRVCFRLEGMSTLENETRIIDFEIDSQFKLSSIRHNFDSVFESDDSLDSKYVNVLDELASIFSNPEIEIIQNNDSKNDPFLADPRNLNAFWDVDGFLLKNQGKDVIKLSPLCEYTMIIRNRSKH